MTSNSHLTTVIPASDATREFSGPVFWIAVVLLFVVVHSPHEVMLSVVDRVTVALRGSEIMDSSLRALSGKYASSNGQQLSTLILESIALPAKKLAFMFAVVVLLIPMVRGIKHVPDLWKWKLLRPRLAVAAKLFALLAVLVIPLKLRSLGDFYARLSLSPFDASFDVVYRRVFVPAVANLFGFSGSLFYLLFSLIGTVVLIVLILYWCERRGMQLPFVVMLSLMTSSAVMFNFEMPGYPDQFVMILALVLTSISMSPSGRLAVIVLSLAIHEASVFVILPLVILAFNKSEALRVVIILLLYGFLFLVSIGFDVSRVMDIHTRLDSTSVSSIDYFIRSPLLALAGVAVAYKLFWIVVVLGFVHMWKLGNHRIALSAMLVILVPFFLLPVAVDTSRFAGFGFIGVLMLLQPAIEMIPASGWVRKLAMVNIVLPSFYVGVNAGVIFQPGLYAAVYSWLC